MATDFISELQHLFSEKLVYFYTILGRISRTEPSSPTESNKSRQIDTEYSELVNEHDQKMTENRKRIEQLISNYDSEQYTPSFCSTKDGKYKQQLYEYVDQWNADTEQSITEFNSELESLSRISSKLKKCIREISADYFEIELE
jgi:gas vesicle protein